MDLERLALDPAGDLEADFLCGLTLLDFGISMSIFSEPLLDLDLAGDGLLEPLPERDLAREGLLDLDLLLDFIEATLPDRDLTGDPLWERSLSGELLRELAAEPEGLQILILGLPEWLLDLDLDLERDPDLDRDRLCDFTDSL